MAPLSNALHIWNGNRSETRAKFEAVLLEKLLLHTKTVASPDQLIICHAPRDTDQAEGNIFAEGFDITISIADNPKFLNVDKIVVPQVVDFGILGCRAGLIKADNLKRYRAMTTSDLQQTRMVFPRDWSDLRIYQENRFNVVGCQSLDDAVHKVATEQADFLPLGINEIAQIKTSYQNTHPMLAIEAYHLLYYPMPLQIYCHARHKRLSQALSRGLLDLTQRGYLRQLFNAHYGAAIEACDLDQRTVHRLDNPLLGHESPFLRYLSPLISKVDGN